LIDTHTKNSAAFSIISSNADQKQDLDKTVQKFHIVSDIIDINFEKWK